MSDVIDWDEAMQQCGDDEEFLRELLADLRDETNTQMVKIESTINVSRNFREPQIGNQMTRAISWYMLLVWSIPSNQERPLHMGECRRGPFPHPPPHTRSFSHLYSLE